MKKPLAVLIVFLAMLVALATQPSAARAGGRQHHHGDVKGFIGGVPAKPFIHHHPFRHHPFPHHPFRHHPFRHHVGPVVRPFFFHRHVFPTVIYPFAYAPPPVVYSPPPTVYVQPAPVVAAQTPSVIEYPTGRYELRGDGITTPYTWVWIPNPPPPPTTPPEVPPAPSMEGAPDPAPSVEQEPRVPAELYHWVDDEGVRYWTDRLDKVPERYRPGAGSRELPGVGS